MSEEKTVAHKVADELIKPAVAGEEVDELSASPINLLGTALYAKEVQRLAAEEAMDKMIKNPPNRATRRALRRAMRKRGSKR